MRYSNFEPVPIAIDDYNKTIYSQSNKMIFQLIYPSNDRVITKCKKQYCDAKGLQFHLTASKFANNYGETEVKVHAQTKQHAKLLVKCASAHYYHQGNLCADENTKFIENELRIRIHKSALLSLLKIEIAKVFDGLVDEKNIELFDQFNRSGGHLRDSLCVSS